MQDWYDKEPSIRLQLTTELQRLFRRARTRPLRVLLAASLVTAVLVWYVANRTKIYDARIVLKVSESEISQERTPLPMQGLHDYVATLSFSKDNLLKVIDELELFPDREELGDDLVVQIIRGGIDVEVYRNFFASSRGYGSAPRSARIAVHYYHSDPGEAYRIAKRLSQLVVESAHTRRLQRRNAGVRDAEAKVEAARERLQARYKAIAMTGVELSEASGKPKQQTLIRQRIRHMENSAKLDRDILRSADEEHREMDLNRAAAAEDLGLQFSIVDERIPQAPPSRRNFLIMIGLMAFFVVLPLSAITIGAFDSRIHDREDVKRLGFEVVGHVPGFVGDDVGSMRSRGAKRDRVT